MINQYFFVRAFARFFRAKEKLKVFPNKYQVWVSVDHPRVIGHVTSFPILIDANDKNHARRQLREQLTFFIGGARKIN